MRKQAKKAANQRSRHGLHAVMARVKLKGLAAIDGRTAAARALLAFKRELLESLGGESKLSPQKRALVEGAVVLKLYIAHLDAYLLALPTLLNRRKRAAIPAVQQRQELWAAFERTMTRLGLDAVEPAPPSLAEYLAKKYGGEDRTGEPAEPEDFEPDADANAQANVAPDDSAESE